MHFHIGSVALVFVATVVGFSANIARGGSPVCEQDDCNEATIPNLNDPADLGDCDQGLLAGPCSRPFSNLGCDPTVIGTNCTVQPGDPPSPDQPFGADTWMRYTMQGGEYGVLTVSTCPADGGSFSGDGMVALYARSPFEGCPTDLGNPTVCGDDTCSISQGPATVSMICASQGADIYIRVGGRNGAQGEGVLVLSLDVTPRCHSLPRPNPNPELGLGVVAGSTVQSCNNVSDCSNAGFGVVPNVDCIPAYDGTFPGTCYASAARYLSISPNPLNESLTARRITLDTNDNDTFDPNVDHVLGWMGEPFATIVAGPEPSPLAQARLQETSSGAYRNWNDLTDINPGLTGAQPVHLGDCEIAPKGSVAQGAVIGNTYFIQAINFGADESDEANYSLPLRLRTTARYGDPVGTGTGGNYPNQGVSLLDAFAAVKGFQGIQLVPKWRLEMTGTGLPGGDNVPNFGNVSLADVFDIVGAFTNGGEYPYSQPCACDGQRCP